jgi:hypothetical protein
MSPLLRAVPTCCICGKLLQLENCNFDEDGQAMHRNPEGYDYESDDKERFYEKVRKSQGRRSGHPY